MSALSVSRLSVKLGHRAIVRNASFELRAGEVVGLLGPNGAGKSTLMRALAGLLPFTGSASWDGTSLAGMNAATRAKTLAWLPQERIIHWPLAVRAAIMLGRLPHQGFARRPARADHDAVDAAMTTVQVSHLADRPVTEISGGELARVLAARVIAQNTPLVLADEPAAGLDPAHQIRLMAAFRTLARDGKAVFVCLHDIELAARWCDRIMIMREGVILADGPPHDAITMQTMAQAYGISVRIGESGGAMTLTPLALQED